MSLKIDERFRVNVGNLLSQSSKSDESAKEFLNTLLEKSKTLTASARKSTTDWIAVVTDRNDTVLLSQFGYQSMEAAKKAAADALDELSK
jgi:hypothetical protein